jgi:hypothetical protein
MAWLLASALFTALAPLSAAHVASRDTRPLRFWASHPWLVFWLSYVVIGPVVVVAFLGVADRIGSSVPRPVGLALALAVFAPALLTTITSASLGLRRTWQKSRPKAACVVLVVAVIIVYLSGPPPPGVSPGQAALRLLTPSVVVVSWWILMAIATDYFARRLILRNGGQPDPDAVH